MKTIDKWVSRRHLVKTAVAGLFASALRPGAAFTAATPNKIIEGSNRMNRFSPILELRQYTLRSGTREKFTNLFEREFIESQEASGIKVIGQFVDLDDPDRFVWIRGFTDMDSRKAGLTAFYGSDLWKMHRSEANSSIVDSDNVLLLRANDENSGFPAELLERPGISASPAPGAVLLAVIHYLNPDMLPSFSAFFASKMKPNLKDLGMSPIGEFVTEPSENTFPGLPVRSNDLVFVWFAQFKDMAECDSRLARMRGAQGRWREGAPDPILHQLARKPEVLRLLPSRRSALRLQTAVS